MARHFLQLYLLIVVTLLAASWGQERLWETYGARDSDADAAENRAQAAALLILEEQLRTVPFPERRRFVAQLAARTGVDFELFEPRDISGAETLARLQNGESAFMSTADDQAWMLKRLHDDGRVLAFRYAMPQAQRGYLEWLLALLFYAAIALVIMIWLWPLTRDLRRLEQATMNFGNRNWVFDAAIGPQSQVYALAQAFRRMAVRIDSLIRSHQDMSNALSHEIKTPLARMRFGIEMARGAATPQQLARHLDDINTDIGQLNGFVTATLDYAILERAEVALNVATHDFTQILPALTESMRRNAQAPLDIRCEVAGDATAVRCDAHLMETVLRNLLYNAIRYARRQIRVSFTLQPDAGYRLCVDDDGPGIAEADRERVFGSFVRLAESRGDKAGYGLGLAIVKRVAQWHGGEAAVTQSELGGARFCVRWSRR